ncbi:Gfo/Idh/MocA family protein [Paenibacillus sp. J2TS4]|uniref:Gfo/Idh/MocA family protein n=1 Tax=Paenibacillus sp. J2TS4 TaxID=2807194 RepID=UPI001B203107|nr:Gfo/Idh/MocA family oxidoreductase [Paenibacillus sp. J2TS4]GIP33768.1 dehydrogenase [Paenibacillus sp. J2TS4]
MLKIGMASYWHVHAGDYARQVEAHPLTELAAVWDEDPKRGHAVAEVKGIKFFESYKDMLAEVDAVIIDTPTTMHEEVLIAAAEAGKHIFTEKVIAPTWKEVRAILDAVEANGVKLMVSLPRLYFGYTLAVREVVENHRLGQVTLVRSRLSHNGAIPTDQSPTGWLPAHFFNKEQCGGGAMIDLGCHPMYLVRLLLGMPDTVSATYGHITGREVEDNAVSVLQYNHGAIGIVEAGFVNRFSPFALEVHGTEGSLLYSTHDEKMIIRSTAMGQEYVDEWKVNVPVPQDDKTAFEQWIDHINNGTEAVENIQLAADLTKLMEASNRSVSESRAIAIRELA